MILLYFLLIGLGAGIGAYAAGLVFWKALLVGVGVFAGVNLLYVIFWVIVASTVNVKKPLEKQRRLCRLGCASIAGWLCAWGGVRVTLSGEELLPKEGRFLFVCNHRSMFDPLVTANVLRDYNISFISKPSNISLPFIGPLAYGAGYLPINRENDREALKTILLAADYLKRDLCSVGVYPEGTRSKTGKMGPFHAGSFKTAQKANVPVVVTAIRGTEKVSRNFPFRRTDVELAVLEVIPAAQVKAMNTQELSARCRERIAEHLGEELAE